MYKKNPKAIRNSLGTYHFLRNRVDSANGFSVSLLGIVTWRNRVNGSSATAPAGSLEHHTEHIATL